MKRISELFSDIKIGGTPSRGNSSFFNGKNLWVSIRDMEGQPVITSTLEHLSNDGIANSNCKLILKGSLLFSFKLTVGRVSFAGVDLYTNEAIAAFSPKEAEACGIDLNYLSIVLPVAAQKDMTRNSMGARLLNKEKIYDLVIPVPLIEEQLQIISHFKSQITEVEKAKLSAIRNKQDLASLAVRQSEQTLELLRGQSRVTLSDFLEGIEAGKSIKTSELIAKKDELGVLKVSAVSWNRFQPDEAKSVIDNYQPRDEHRVRKGDFLISRANTIDLVGAVVLVDDNYPNRLLSDKTLRLNLNKQIIPEFLLEVLKLPEARKYIESNATGTSDSMRNISQKAIRNIPVPLASEFKQRQVIEITQETKKNVEKINTALITILKDLDVLRYRLLQEVFDN